MFCPLQTRTLAVSGAALPTGYDGAPILTPTRLSGCETLGELSEYTLLLKTPDALAFSPSEAANLDLDKLIGTEVSVNVWKQYLKYENDFIYNDADSGLRVLCVGLSATFYFWGGETRERRLAIANCFEAFEQRFARRLEWVRPCEDVSRSVVKIGGKKAIPTLLEYVGKMDPDDELDWTVSGGRSANEASDCYMATLTVRHWMTTGTLQPLSWLNFSIPVEDGIWRRGKSEAFY